MAVIKANAYGHGIIPVARALDEADSFAVARIQEGIHLRDAGIESAIILLQGVQTAENLRLAHQHRLELVVHSANQLELLEQSPDVQVAIWLKLNTGMNRLGFTPRDFPAAFQRLQDLVSVRKPVRLMSHFADAETSDSEFTSLQLKQFLDSTREIPAERSIANSAAILGIPDSHFDWVRPGISLYGVSSLRGKTGLELGLRPAMQFSTSLVATRTLTAAQTVGYGRRWQATGSTVIGIAACGYGDGYPWALPDGTPVLVNGAEAALVGRVSMDLIAIDLGVGSSAGPGDEVILWGDQLPVERIAAAANTVAYELLCGVSQRVRRQWSD